MLGQKISDFEHEFNKFFCLYPYREGVGMDWVNVVIITALQKAPNKP